MRHHRVYTRAGSALVVFAGLSLSFGSALAAAAVPDLSGIYWATEYHAKIQPVGGGEPPFTPAGRAAYNRNVAGLKDGSIPDSARKYCTPDGPARSLATPYPFEIVQGPPGQVLILHELNHMIRAIQLDKKLPSLKDVIADPWEDGHEVGHYEGDTLVINAIGFKDATYLDATGTPHTDQLVTTERVRKVSPAQLEIVITIHDPSYYTKDWQARFVYQQRKDLRIEEYVCGAAHRDISHMPGIAEARGQQRRQ